MAHILQTVSNPVSTSSLRDVRRRLLSHRIATSDVHPFAESVNRDSVRSIGRNYLGFLEALSPLWAGRLNKVLRTLNRDEVLESSRKLKPYVSCSAEVDRKRSVALIDALGDDKNLALRHELQRVMGWAIKPDYDPLTIAHLRRIQIGVTDLGPVDAVGVVLAMQLQVAKGTSVLADSLTRMFALPENNTIQHCLRSCGQAAVESHSLPNSQYRTGAVLAGSLSGILEAVEWYYKMSVTWCNEIASIGDQ